MKLREFLEKHIVGMLVCFNLTHFGVKLARVKKLVALMDIYIDYEYLTAEIRYGKKIDVAWKLGQKERIIQILSHEITHIITGEVTDDLTIGKARQKTEERANEHLSRLLYRLYRRK
jgi:hypothetical protein